jgi:hypothetical protein
MLEAWVRNREHGVAGSRILHWTRDGLYDVAERDSSDGFDLTTSRALATMLSDP